MTSVEAVAANLPSGSDPPPVSPNASGNRSPGVGADKSSHPAGAPGGGAMDGGQTGGGGEGQGGAAAGGGGGGGGANGDKTWRCPDPGCKKSNLGSAMACTQCTLPRHSAHQFKRGNRSGGWGRGGGGGGWGNKGGGGGGWGRGGGRGRRGGGGGWGSNRDHAGGGGRYGGGGGRDWRDRDSKGKSLPEGVDPENPVVKMFQGHAKDLDRKHDKHERIVKLSRDITVESKRVIFLLHRILREEDKPTILGEAEHKFGYIRSRLWFSVARELRGEDPYQFLRAFSGGLQEYIEAYSFYYYILHGKLVEWKEIQRELTFYVSEKPRDRRERGQRGGESSPTSQDGESSTVSTVEISEAIKVAEEEAKPGKGEEEPEKGAAAKAVPEKAQEEETQDGGAEVEKEKAAPESDSKGNDDEAEAAAVATPAPSNSTEPAKTKEGEEEGKNDQEKEEEDSKEPTTGAATAAEAETDKDGVGDKNEESSVAFSVPASRGEEKRIEIEVTVPKQEFVLGLADLTGEVMRQAINMVGAGETEVCFKLLRFLHEIAEGFEDIRVTSHFLGRETKMKIKVLLQSLRKVENACYTIEVRGSEIPKSHLAGMFRSALAADHHYEQGGASASGAGAHDADAASSVFSD